ncbi:MAG: hypothetical protein N4A33_12110 [Bacteriovoracaceae bacterium]|jgi:hypothetical protein|nr:hypothetical protein [Bacteriovoracaceae bacterium]
MKIILLFLLFTYSLFAQPNCALLYQKWNEIDGVVEEVDAYLIPGAKNVFTFKEYQSIKTLDDNSIILTKNFFRESGIPIPKNAKPIKIGTYHYYTKNSLSTRASRGSGRGHILLEQPNKGRIIEFKGSGTNEFFSSVNSGMFDVKDYRRNGLAVMDELTTEMIMGRMFEKHGVPISMSFEMKMMPEFIQDLAKTKGYDKAAVQISRQMNMGRESLYGGLKAPAEDRMKLIGKMYSINGQLGAINPENMTFGAKLLDLGHTNVGYPLTSGAYRCLLCKELEGSSWDKTLVGFFDYYFENIPSYAKLKSVLLKDQEYRDIINRFRAYRSKTKQPDTKALWNEFTKNENIKGYSYSDVTTFFKYDELYDSFDSWKVNIADKLTGKESENELFRKFLNNNFRNENISYSFKLSEKNAKLFLKELTSHLNVNKLDINLSQEQLDAIVSVIREDLRISRSWTDVRGFGEKIIGIKLPKNVAPDRLAFSFKSLMQISALKYHLSAAEFKHLTMSMRNMVNNKNVKNLNIILGLFDEIYKAKNLTKKETLKLFEEFIPTNVIQSQVTKTLAKANNQADAIKLTRQLVDTYTRPILVSPRNYYDELLKLESKKTVVRKNQYMSH